MSSKLLAPAWPGHRMGTCFLLFILLTTRTQGGMGYQVPDISSLQFYNAIFRLTCSYRFGNEKIQERKARKTAAGRRTTAGEAKLKSIFKSP